MSKGGGGVYYFLGTIGLFGVFLIGFFHLDIQIALPFISSYFIIIAAAIFFSLFGYSLFGREKETVNMEYQFLTIATHKFRTPLTAIKWLIGNLRKEVSREEKIDIVNKIESSVDRLSETVDILTGLAKFSDRLDYAFEMAWLREMIDASLLKNKNLFSEKNITFSIATDHEIPLVLIDKRKIQFVIDMLLENAISYSQGGGKIDIFLDRRGKFVIMSVKDYGLGIEPENLSKIFQPFFRTKDARAADTEGMGLGLFVINEIVKKHGGRVWAESAGKGKGSTFFVKLKISENRN